MKPCPFCAEEIQDAAVKCRFCGSLLEERPAQGGDGLQAVIPTKNPLALGAYYMGCFAFIPPFGLVLGPVALLLGLMSWSRIRREPGLPGLAHAWAGIVLGGLVLLGYGLLIAAMFAK